MQFSNMSNVFNPCIEHKTNRSLAIMTSEKHSGVSDFAVLLRCAEGFRDIVVANAVMVGEIPAFTGAEEQRAAFLAQRFSEEGLLFSSTDSCHNVIALLPGTEGSRSLLVSTNIDTLLDDPMEQTVEVQDRYLVGPFVVDNCIAVGAFLALPALLDAASIKLRSNLWIVLAGQCHGQCNLAGLKHALNTLPQRPEGALWVESVQLGRLNYQALGVRRGEIVCRLPSDYNWAQFGSTGTIVPMGEIIGHIARISLPRRPLTTLVLGQIEGGVSHQNIARETVLRFEVRSEDAEQLRLIENQLRDIAMDISANRGVTVTVNIFSQRQPGGLPIEHPMVQKARQVLTQLGLDPMMYPTTSAMSGLVEYHIPSLTVGVTSGMRRAELKEWDETADIALLPKGMTQLAALLVALDEAIYGEPK